MLVQDVDCCCVGDRKATHAIVHIVMPSQYVRIAHVLNTRYPWHHNEQIPLPPILWSRVGTRGSGIEKIPNLPKCWVTVSKKCRTLRSAGYR